MTRTAFAAAALVTAVAAAAAAAPPQVDRRSRDEPEIVVQAGGRTGTCDVVRFTPDGRFLLAAGDDKVVSVWPHAAAGLDPDPKRARVLRWPAWRERRGGIKAVAVSPDGKRVAVGGIGMITSAVAILDRDGSGEHTKLDALTWPTGGDGEDVYGAVTAVAFDAAGKRVAFGTADGSLWVWTPTKLAAADADGRTWSAPVRAGKHTSTVKGTGENDLLSRLVFFRDADTLVSVSRQGQVARCPIADKPTAATPVFDLLDDPARTEYVFRAEPTADGSGIVAGVVGRPSRVQFRSLDGKTAASVSLGEGRMPRGLAVHPTTGRVAVGVGGLVAAKEGVPRFLMETPDEVWLFDDLKDGAAPARKLALDGPAEALAFAPTEKDRLAVAGGPADEVTLYDLAKPGKPLSVVRGLGRKVFAVGLSESGKVLRVRTDRDPSAVHPNAAGSGEWCGFDLNALEPTDDTVDPRRKWLAAVDEADGWRVEPDPVSRAVWSAVAERDGKAVRVRLVVDTDLYNFPVCYTFVPKSATTPTRLLVGHDLGCSLYELPAGAPPAAGLRPALTFVGHSSAVLSVAAARDGSWFVTGGADQTVAAFALDRRPAPPTLGAALDAPDGEDRVRVAKVEVGGPAWEAGLQADDRLDLLAVGPKLVYERRAKAPRPVGTPAEALAALARPAPGELLTLGVVPPGGAKRRYAVTSVVQRPLWKLFQADYRNGRAAEWVIWMWKGSYYSTKSMGGDSLAGWHVNAPAVDGGPRFYKLNQFQNQYLNSRVVRTVVGRRDLAEALKEAQGENPQAVSFGEQEPSPVELALDHTRLPRGGDASVAVTLTVNPRGSDRSLLPERVELWVNDYRVGSWAGDPTGKFERRVKLPPGVFRGGVNQLTAVAVNPAGGRVVERRDVTNENPAAAANLVGLAVGVNDYGRHREVSKGSRAELKDLRYAAPDAAGVSAALQAFVGKDKFFPTGRVTRREDADAGRDDLLAGLDALKTQAKPDDVLVLFLAGHGVLVGDRKGGGTEVVDDKVENPDKEYKDVRFVFCCPDFDAARPTAAAVSAAELFDKLAGVNCRKVVLLDVCHSGQAADADLIRRFVPGDEGPFVMAACDRSQLSWENPQLGHGLFTAALLEAVGDKFDDADTGRDGKLSCGELTAYVRRRVEQLRTRDTKEKRSDQSPICYPPVPPRFTVVSHGTQGKK